MRDESKFTQLFVGAGEAMGPGSEPVPPLPARVQRSSGTALLIDSLIGLAVRAALIVQLWGWSRANAAPVNDPLSWRSWVTPSDGLERAAGVWMMGQFDPQSAAFLLLMTATLTSLMLVAGVLARLAGLAVLAGAVWHSVFVMPEAWPTNVIYAVMGLYLMLRGAGTFSLDWVLARLARLG